MPDRYQALRNAIAAGPTPGARFQGRSPHAYCIYDKQCWYAPDGSRHGETPNLIVTVSPDDAAADAQFIAAADPDTIRALLQERDALREAPQEVVRVQESGVEVCEWAASMIKAHDALDCATGSES